MNNSLKLYATHCAICEQDGNATEIYPANFTPEAFNQKVFSARRLPDRIHYRMVKCNTCGLVRSDPIADRSLLEQLYVRSTFDYSEEVENLKSTYGRYLDRLEKYGVTKEAILEIGCGNGFFLEEALNRDYAHVYGVEPSTTAVEHAADHIQSSIVCDIMHPGLFKPNMFDVICLFQVFDHLVEPNELLEESNKILKPGGLLLFINHNVESLSSRLMKEKSPIIDIEHTYLYSLDTMKQIVSKHGFNIKEVSTVTNLYSLYYLMRLVPLPNPIKTRLLSLLQWSHLGKITLSIPLGNLCLIAQKG